MKALRFLVLSFSLLIANEPLTILGQRKFFPEIEACFIIHDLNDGKLLEYFDLEQSTTTKI
jgi:hypothetical protein